MAMRVERKTEKQKGVALLLVLLLLATLSITAIAVIETMTLATARMQAGGERNQARWHQQSLEALVINLLEKQAQTGPRIDTYSQSWLADEIIIPLDQGVIVIRLADSTACFNLNALVKRDGNRLIAKESEAQRLQKMMQGLGLSGMEASRFSGAVTDWIDSDGNASQFGAEDSFYTRLDQPFRTSGQFLVSVSEVRPLAQVSPPIYRMMQTYTCALPMDSQPKINVNLITMKQLPVLLTAFDGLLSLEETRRLIEQRPQKGYQDLSEFFAMPVFTGKEIAPEMQSRFQIWSEYLTLNAEIRYGSALLQSKSLLHRREGGGVTILSREFGPQL
jgi:general secretion pathway protein K